MAETPRTQRRRKKLRVPYIVGLKEADARLVLQHAGFFDPELEGTPEAGSPRIDIRYTKSFSPYGTVVSQQPAKGQIVNSGQTIRLTVSMESLLDYLPAVYRRPDVMGGNFVREFLWIFQHIFYSIESKIARIHTYFDVLDAPDEFLPWLASWVAFSLDGSWSEDERRLFLKEAVELYRVRGTVKGLKSFLNMYTGVEAEIIENSWPLDGFQIGVASTIGKDSAILPPINRAHCFIVEVPLDADDLEDDEIIKIHQIIRQEKPAHTTYYLRFTGSKSDMKRWSGPVIGQYMVGSTPMTSVTPEHVQPDEPAVEKSAKSPEKEEAVASQVAPEPPEPEPEKRAKKKPESLRSRRKPSKIMPAKEKLPTAESPVKEALEEEQQEKKAPAVEEESAAARNYRKIWEILIDCNTVLSIIA